RRRNAGIVCRIERVYALVPVITAKRTARQIHLHHVVELTIAGVGFDLAVVKYVIGDANTRSDLLSPAELKVREALRIVCRQLLLCEPHAKIQRQSVPNLPGILNIEL